MNRPLAAFFVLVLALGISAVHWMDEAALYGVKEADGAEQVSSSSRLQKLSDSATAAAADVRQIKAKMKAMQRRFATASESERMQLLDPLAALDRQLAVAEARWKVFAPANGESNQSAAGR